MFRLVFNSIGVGVGVVIRSVELNDLVKTASDSAYDSVEYDQVKTGSSELKQEETEELSQSQIVGTCFVIGLSFRYCFRLRLRFSLDSKQRSHKRSREKMETF